MRKPLPDPTRLGTRAGGIACACVSGLLYALAFPPAALFPLAWVALAPLCFALARVGPWAGAGLGLLFGAVAGVSLGWWLPGSIAGFFDLGVAGAGLYAAGAILLCIFPFAGFGAAVSALARRGKFSPFGVALAWGLCEALRVHGPVPTPWALLAYSQAPWLAIVQVADVAGVLGLGCLIAAVNAALAGFAPALRSTPRFALQTTLTAALLLAGWGYGLQRLDEEFAYGEEIAVAVVQPAVEPARRFDAAHRGENLARHLELTRSVATSNASLVVWPELAIDFPIAAEPELWRSVRELSRDFPGDILLGAQNSRRRLLLLEPLNSALLLRAGRVVDRHDKISLMPFAETRPAALPLGIDRFRPGLELRALASSAGPLGVLICSEALHPELATQLAAGGAEILVNPSNDDWFGSRAGAEHQVAVAVFRAVETRRFVLRSSTSGRSAVVDPHGRIVALAPYGDAAVLEARVRRSRATSPLTRSGRALPGGATALAALSLFQLVAIRRHAP
jgi:apolipoprotein N-acyltransferase